MKRILEFCGNIAIKAIIAIFMLFVGVFFTIAALCGLILIIVICLAYLFTEVKDALTK